MKYEGRSIIFVLSHSRNARAIVEAADDTGTVCHESNESVQEKEKRKTEGENEKEREGRSFRIAERG